MYGILQIIISFLKVKTEFATDFKKKKQTKLIKRTISAQ